LYCGFALFLEYVDFYSNHEGHEAHEEKLMQLPVSLRELRVLRGWILTIAKVQLVKPLWKAVIEFPASAMLHLSVEMTGCRHGKDGSVSIGMTYL
jgi:hypothetical protein